MKLEIGLVSGTPGLIIEEDPLGLTVVEVMEVAIDAVTDEEGFHMAPRGLGLELAEILVHCLQQEISSLLNRPGSVTV